MVDVHNSRESTGSHIQVFHLRGAMCRETNIMPIVGKIYCSPSRMVLTVRKRPAVVNGGGFVVLNGGQVIFTVEGCGILGAQGELMLRDGDGAPVLFIREKGGLVQAVSVHNRWKGYLMDYDGPTKLIFTLREPKSCLVMKNGIRVSLEPKSSCNRDWDFEVNGSFIEKSCSINDRNGNIVAQVRVKDEMMLNNKDLYHVVVQPGCDQAFVVGVIAVLDNIYGESTRC